MTATLDATLVTEPGVYDLDDQTYHADPTPHGSLSSTGARTLLRCPAIYRYQREHPPESTTVFDIGKAAHRLVLGAGPAVLPVDAKDWRTNAAKAEREKITAAGGVALLRSEFDQVQAMATALAEHPVARVLFSDGTPEASLFWVDAASEVWRRARLDWLPTPTAGRMIIPDFKTAQSADPQQFARSAMNFGYHQQAAWYQDAVRALGLAEDPAFVFVVQEKTPPYIVSVVELDVVALRIGRRLNAQAIGRYAECVSTGHWPGYVEDVALVSLPGWYENKFSEDI